MIPHAGNEDKPSQGKAPAIKAFTRVIHGTEGELRKMSPIQRVLQPLLSNPDLLPSGSQADRQASEKRNSNGKSK